MNKQHCEYAKKVGYNWTCTQSMTTTPAEGHPQTDKHNNNNPHQTGQEPREPH